MKTKNELKTLFSEFPNAKKICQILIKEGAEARLIGGAVRSFLAGREVHDIDIATNINPEDIEGVLLSHKVKYKSIGKAFGTVTAFINGEKVEITSLRRDIECDGRKAIVEYTNSWQEDAARRDFTINAMSTDLHGNLYDYFGGFEDLKNSVVKFIGDPEQRIKEDYLRILRFFRFSAFYAKSLNSEGLKACAKYREGLKKISAERIRYELEKICLAPNAMKILISMHQDRIIEVDKNNLVVLENLYSLFNEFSCEIDDLLCMSVLFYKSREENDFLLNSAFSSREQRLIKSFYTEINSDFSEESLINLWKKYQKDFLKISLFLLAFKYKLITPVVTANIKNMLSIELKPLPINGDDLIKLGLKPGKMIGQALERARHLWYKSYFHLSKEKLIQQIID